MSAISPLVGEHLALDLVNTRVNLPRVGRLDLLETVPALRHWIDCEADRLPGAVTAGPTKLTKADLDAVRAVRAHAATAVQHARCREAPSREALRGLNEAQRAAPVIDELYWDGSAVAAVEKRAGSPGVRLAAHLAEATAGLLTDPKVTTIKECEAGYCVLLFLPAHPRRRWCSAKVCGNRARVARHYRRHHDASAESSQQGLAQ